MLGYDKEELVGKLWPGFVDDEWLDKVNKEWEAQKSGKSNRYEIKLKRKDKSSIWAQVNGLSIMDKDGEYTGTLEAFKDITEQKNAENALRKSEEKFRALFDNTVYAFLLEEPIFDENGNVIDVTLTFIQVENWDKTTVTVMFPAGILAGISGLHPSNS